MYLEKCQRILEWSDDHPGRMDTEFVESVYEQIQERDFITDAQKAGIDRILDGFGIEQ